MRKLFVTIYYQVPSIDHVMFGKELGARYVTVFSINKETRQIIEVNMYYYIFLSKLF